MANTTTNFGEITKTEAGTPVIEIGKGSGIFVGPFRKYCFSVGPLNDIGQITDSGICHFNQLTGANKGTKTTVVINCAAMAVVDYCTREGLPIPNVSINNPVWKRYINIAYRFIFNEPSDYDV